VLNGVGARIESMEVKENKKSYTIAVFAIINELLKIIV